MITSAPLTPVDTESDIEEVLEVPTQAEIKKKSMRGVLSYMGRSVFLQGLALLTTALMAGYLSPAEYGVFGLVTQVTLLVAFFSDIGLGYALIQKQSKPTLTEYRTAFTLQLLLSLGIAIVCGGLVASNILEPKIGSAGEWLLLALGLSFGISTLKTVPTLMLERELAFSKLVIPQLVEQAVYSAVLIFSAARGLGVSSYTWAVLARAVIGVVIMYLIQSWSVGLSLDTAALKGLLSKGLKFQLNDILGRIKDNVYYLVLGLFLPTQQFGYISLAKQYSQLPYSLTVQNVIAVTFPTFSRLQHDLQLLKRAIEKTIFFITLCIFPLLVGMAVLIRPLMLAVPEYAKWLPASATFIYFTLSIAAAAVSTPLTNTLAALGKLNQQLGLMIMWTVLTWVLTPFFYQWFGFDGIALAALVISATSIVPVILVKRIVPLAVTEQLWRQTLAAAIMLSVGWLTRDVWSQSLGWWLLGGVTLMLVYGITVLIVGYHKVSVEVRSLIHHR